jgi:predicted SnoaL-like aldol condensation-catalyzing enzyme
MKKLFLIIALMFLCNAVMADSKALEFNKKLVVEFYTEVLFHGRADAIDKYIGDIYVQHNPNVADGKEALRQLIKSFPPREKDTPPSGEIVRVVAEDDLVVLHVKNYSWPSPNGGAIVDIFRVENNKIVEHWDVVQAIPEKSKNNNTMF